MRAVFSWDRTRNWWNPMGRRASSAFWLNQWLSCPFHSGSLAVFGDDAAGAEGAEGAADVLAVEDQEGVDALPVFLGQIPAQGHFGFLRVFRANPAGAVADSVYVNIHADTRQIKGFDEHQIRRFPAHTGQGQQGVHVGGNLAAVFVQDDCGDLL
jgi:hypothetical protein